MFTTKDAADGYFLVNMAEKDKHLTAFISEWGLFEFNVMSFGLTNAPATFQRIMNQILSKEIGQTCLVYLDDILVFSQDMESHFRDIYVVCFRLAQRGVRLKWKKCKFGQKEVEYLGHVISMI